MIADRWVDNSFEDRRGAAVLELVAVASYPPRFWRHWMRDEYLSEVQYHMLRTHFVNATTFAADEDTGATPFLKVRRGPIEVAAALLVDWRESRKRYATVSCFVPGKHFHYQGRKFDTLEEAQEHLRSRGLHYGGLRERHLPLGWT